MPGEGYFIAHRTLVIGQSQRPVDTELKNTSLLRRSTSMPVRRTWSLYFVGMRAEHTLTSLPWSYGPQGSYRYPMLRKDLLPTDTDAVTQTENEIVSSARPPRGSLEISPGSEGLEAWVTIRLPVPAFESQNEEQRRTEVLSRARRMIDHALQAETQPPPLKRK
jgi:hypothetical protein